MELILLYRDVITIKLIYSKGFLEPVKYPCKIFWIYLTTVSIGSIINHGRSTGFICMWLVSQVIRFWRESILLVEETFFQKEKIRYYPILHY